jgi:hypothetical protein
MNTSAITESLVTLATELVHGGPKGGSYILNGGDAGMLGSLDKLSAAQASASSHGGATIAAHVEHVAYGLSLLNRWNGGEANPYADADWGKAWERTSVTDAEWEAVRDDLRAQVRSWMEALRRPPRAIDELSDYERNGLVGSLVHLAYHLGAIRQIDKTTRGPKDGE